MTKSAEVTFSKILVQNQAPAWLGAFAVLALVLVSFALVQRYVSKRLVQLGQSRRIYFFDFLGTCLRRTKALFVLVIALYAGSLVLALPRNLARLFLNAALLSLLLQLALWSDYAIRYYLARKAEQIRDQDVSRTSGFAALGFVLRALLWTVVALLLLQNIGIDVTALAAGLGIGGVAVALAVQNILGDLFCSISILLDKPFEAGDFIIVDTKMGVVEKIGIKSTRIRSIQGEQVIISNSDLIKSRIQNFKRMAERRIVFTVGVTYGTSAEQLEKIPAMLKSIVLQSPATRFDRAHFKELGPYSLNFEVVYYIQSSDYNLYMDVQQAINLAVYREFAGEGIDFAFPTQTVQLAETPPRS